MMRSLFALCSLLFFVLELIGALGMAIRLWRVRERFRFALWWGRAFTCFFLGEVILFCAAVLRGPGNAPAPVLLLAMLGRLSLCLSIWICIGFLAGWLNGHKTNVDAETL